MAGPQVSLTLDCCWLPTDSLRLWKKILPSFLCWSSCGLLFYCVLLLTHSNHHDFIVAPTLCTPAVHYNDSDYFVRCECFECCEETPSEVCDRSSEG